MHLSLFVLLVIGVVLQQASANPASFDDFVEREAALEFMSNDNEMEAVKRLLYSGHEQRREVKEKYEEKCERKLISKTMKKPRWCPELNEWPAWREVSKNDPVKPKNRIGK